LRFNVGGLDVFLEAVRYFLWNEYNFCFFSTFRT
jgi:hypothetical protein